MRTASDIKSAAVALLDSRGSGIRTEEGEPINDVIDAFAAESFRQEVLAQYNELINSTQGWRQLLGDTAFQADLADALGISATTLDQDLARTLGVPEDLPSDVAAVMYLDLNRFAVSFGRPRKAAQFATGIERLYVSSNTPFTLFRGAGVRTSGVNQQVQYTTSDDLTAVTPSFDASQNKYYVEVAIKCQTAGKVGVKIKGTINAVVTSIPGVVAVTNPNPTVGGLDREADSDLLDALDGVLGGTDINTSQGLTNWLAAQPGVQDSLVVGPGDPLMLRATAGAVDVYIIGAILKLATVQVQVQAQAAGEKYVFSYQPTIEVNSVVGILVYTEGGGFTFDKDTGVFAGSARDNTGLDWQFPPGGPGAGELVLVTFTYNSLIYDLQRQLDEDPNREVPGSANLLKLGLEKDVIFTMKVIALPGITQTAAEQAVQDVLTSYLQSFKLGQPVEFSLALVQAQTAQVSGVNAVDHIDGFELAFVGDSYDVVDLITARNEYARLFDITFIAP